MLKNECRPLSYTIYKINSKWILDLNIVSKTIKLLEENIGGNLPAIGSGSGFLMTQASKENVNYLSLI